MISSWLYNNNGFEISIQEDERTDASNGYWRTIELEIWNGY